MPKVPFLIIKFTILIFLNSCSQPPKVRDSISVTYARDAYRNSDFVISEAKKNTVYSNSDKSNNVREIKIGNSYSILSAKMGEPLAKSCFYKNDRSIFSDKKLEILLYSAPRNQLRTKSYHIIAIALVDNHVRKIISCPISPHGGESHVINEIKRVCFENY